MNTRTASPPQPRWVTCHNCGIDTSHEVLHLASDERWEAPLFRNHLLTRCGGCRSFSYIIEDGDYDERDRYTGELTLSHTVYPNPKAYRAMVNAEELPSKIQKIYAEVQSGMNAQLPVLAGIGLRALIEAVCRDRKVAGRNLAELIDGLATKGVLAAAHANILHAHRFLGNAAAHDVVAAKPGELKAALTIAEAIMTTIYVLPRLSRSMTTGRKRRRKAKPKARPGP